MPISGIRSNTSSWNLRLLKKLRTVKSGELGSRVSTQYLVGRSWQVKVRIACHSMSLKKSRFHRDHINYFGWRGLCQTYLQLHAKVRSNKLVFPQIGEKFVPR
jgi:hypothetical protein